MVRPLGPDHHSLVQVKVEELRPLADDFHEHETHGRAFVRSKKSNLGQQAAFEQAVQEARAVRGRFPPPTSGCSEITLVCRVSQCEG